MSAQWRCDTCNTPHTVEPLRWTYITKSTMVNAKQWAAKSGRTGPGIEWYPDAPPGVAFQSEEWSICQACHEIIQDGTLQQLVSRSVLMQTGGAPLTGPVADQALAEVRTIITTFWRHREPNPKPLI